MLQAGVDDSADVEHQMALKLQLLETELEETQEQLAAQEESLMGLRELLQQRTLKLEQIHDQYTYVKVCVCVCVSHMVRFLLIHNSSVCIYPVQDIAVQIFL